ncbi:MAG TPA: hypothetical protein PK193_01880 [Candidatus Paceibacterota bacterium]|jgi:hypothetical protein|nr:hypothetical protein [Candidatus Paceibacterota bacterium]
MVVGLQDKVMRKILFGLSLCLFLFIPFLYSNAEEKVVIDFFDDRLCSVCKATKDFIYSIEDQYPQIELNLYPITDVNKLAEIASEHGIKDYQVMSPTIFIGDNFFQFTDFTSRHQDMLISAIEGNIVDKDYYIKRIPILNIEVNLKDWSLIFVAIFLGLLDGFNVCSLGALILVLSLALVFNSKKKVFLLGGLFIITTVIVYGVLVFTWGKLFEALVGQIEALRIVIGLMAFAGGVYFLKECHRFYKQGAVCQSNDSGLAKRVSGKLQSTFKDSSSSIYFLMGSVIFFAFAITLIELPCSIGIPVAFTGVLVESGVSIYLYVGYIIVYLFFYMLDELLVFLVAVFTKKIWVANSKAMILVSLIGALVLFYLSFHYIFS